MGTSKQSFGLLFLVSILLSGNFFICRSLADGVTAEEARQLRDEVREMFYHAFDGYMEHAFPLDELRPLSCEGEDSLGGYALTLVDSLDTLALLGDRERFTTSVEWIGKNLQFDIGMKIPSYDNQLLNLAEDLARRLLPAFDTPTGIPFGSVNLLHGVDEHESKAKLLYSPSFKCTFYSIFDLYIATIHFCNSSYAVFPYAIVFIFNLHGSAHSFLMSGDVDITSTAGGGTLTLEFGVLSRLTNDPIFEQVTKKAVLGIWARRSKLNLVGAHINVFTGEWTQKDAGIGTSIDSFYEYLLKASKMNWNLSDHNMIMLEDMYVEVNMDSAAIVWPLFNSLQAFWPGLQVLAGDIDPAVRTHAAFFSVWKRYGFTPEGFNLATLTIQQGQKSYPLRPELIESTYLLYKATRDPRYLDAGRDMVASLQYGTRCPCGYCHISDVEFHKKEDHMESFFLAETVKYLWLLFDLAVGPDNLVENGPYKYIFSTEGHLLPATPQISLKREHCSYFGAYCKDSDSKQGSETSGVSADPQETNGSKFYGSWVHTGFPSDSFLESTSVPGLIKGLCPGLTHGQKYGITYLPLVDTAPEDVSPTQKEPSQPTVVQSHSVVVVSDQGAHLIQSKPNSDHKNAQEVSPGRPESDPPKI
ncbi:alpha-mannosidase I MNS4 [Citrus sinensis]|uniref:Alpha-mannosidase I MNS4 n=1 Tax=Citrus sinensis TaxID=2711 RepID=A0ACB8I5E4_CITSI|nr:alpha-mannosidase I MNS4 [Citrus sinensis]